MNTDVSELMAVDQKLYLTDVLGSKVTLRNKKIGRLADLAIKEGSALPEVMKIIVHRPFGDPSLLIPWDKVKIFKEGEVVVTIESVEKYVAAPAPEEILLRDHLLDKKILDIEDREVEIVYDVKMVARGNKMYVSEVNISKYRLLRRLGLKWLANFLYSLRGKSKGERDEKIPWSMIQPLPTGIGSFRGDVKLKVLKERLADFHPADIADILEELDQGQRVAIFNELDPMRASDTLEQVEPTVQRQLVAALQKERVAGLLNRMTPGQAADILSVLPLADARGVLHDLRTVNPEGTKKIESILGKQEEKIVNFYTRKILKQPQETLVSAAQEYFHQNAKHAAVVFYLYVVDNTGKLVGVLDLKELLQSDEQQTLKEAMVPCFALLHPKSTLKEALELFSRYDFRAIPVTDEHEKLLGAVPYRDVMNLKHRFWE